MTVIERKSRSIVAPLVTLTPDQRTKVLAAIRTRTVEEGECLVWTGAVSTNARSVKRVPAIALDGSTRSLRRMAYVAYGKELFAHWAVSTSCGDDLCLCEKHLRRATRSELQTGTTRGIVTRSKIAAWHQANGPLNWDKVREIRASDLSHRKAAEAYGVNRDTILSIRQHASWRETGMFSSLVA